MTQQFFCADACRTSGELPIGMASKHKHYVLVECSPPWPHQAPQAKRVPDSMRELIDELKRSVRFLFIHSEVQKQFNVSRILFLSRPDGRARSYSKYEAQVSNLNEVVPLVRSYLAGEVLPQLQDSRSIRDILICTHGTHDKCCGKYGYPFYREACEVAAEHNNVRLWQSSHFGGHRFAPTAIDFPEGRYYGFLNRYTFTSILERSGNLDCLKQVYRGWGLLPEAFQFLEKELALIHGWDWFNYKVASRLLSKNEDGSHQYLELEYETPEGTLGGYRANAVVDQCESICVYGDCDAPQPSHFTKFAIHNCTAIDVD